MAQKRMFDKGLIETDAFMDMPMPTKALYFLLGMEADDEGFVSPNRVMRIYGGNADDLKVLLAKKFVIQFESGVIVITDWKKNNWLDNRRVKATVYQAEKALLIEKNDKYILASAKQSLSDGSASIEESRGEENSREENIMVAKPQDVVNYFFELKEWANKDKEFYQKRKIIYARHTKPAKQLLELCDGNLNEAKECLDKISKWAKSRDLDWSIETVFKKWYDLDFLKEKEKKPYIDGRRAFEKNGKWYLIDKTGEIKEYVGSLKSITYA